MEAEARRTEPMASDTGVENVDCPSQSPSTPNGAKRKVVGDGKENGFSSTEKKPRTEDCGGNASSYGSGSTKPLVELKGRKLIFNQEQPSWTIPKRRLLNFEGLLLDAEEAGKKITEIPEEYYGLIVHVGHEMSSATEVLFIKALRTALCKNQMDTLPAEAISPLIPKLFALQQYGILPSDIASASSSSSSSSSSSIKVPAALQIRRWEAIESEKYFSAEILATITSRREERQRARVAVVAILDGMDDVERLELLKGESKLEDKEGKKEKPIAINSSPVQPTSAVRRKSREGTATTSDSRRSMSPGRKTKLTPEEEEAARVKKEEREAKKAALAEKKAAKDAELRQKESEKLKVEAVKAKQAQAFGSFFKPKPTKRVQLISQPPVPTAAGPSTTPAKAASPAISDFVRAFRPVVQKPGVRWAPVNKWAKSNKDELEHISGKEVEGWGTNGSPAVKDWKSEDFLLDHLRKHKYRARALRTRLPRGLKAGPLHGTVGELWLQYQEAADPRKVLDQLQNRSRFPWKTLAFDEQVRPPYCGTFTKKSAVVGARTPFSQDPIFDYSYDSADDWQDDEGGEDVDDFGAEKAREGAEEDEDEEDESEGEFDDWLDDSDDAGYVPGALDGDGDDGLGAPTPDVPRLDQTRLPMKIVKKVKEVPRKVVKVTPSCLGPNWEYELGQESKEFSEYRLQLLNDSPVCLDPFTYIANEASPGFKSTYTTVSIGISNTVRCLLSSDTITPRVPQPAAPVSATHIPAPSAFPSIGQSTDTSATSATPVMPASTKPRASGPKVAFPSTHLPELFSLIEGNTKIRTDLISQLKAHFENVTSKAAIEAKIKEVASREGKTKDSQWKVHPEAWASVGITPPAPVSAPIPSPFLFSTTATTSS